MIKFTWQGPLTGYKDRLLAPGRPAEVEPGPQADTWKALGYLEEPKPPAPKAQDTKKEKKP